MFVVRLRYIVKTDLLPWLLVLVHFDLSSALSILEESAGSGNGNSVLSLRTHNGPVAS